MANAEDEYFDYGDEKSALVSSKQNDSNDNMSNNGDIVMEMQPDQKDKQPPSVSATPLPLPSSSSSSSSPLSTTKKGYHAINNDDDENDDANNKDSGKQEPANHTETNAATTSTLSAAAAAAAASSSNSPATNAPSSASHSRRRNSARLRNNVRGNVRRMSRGSKIILFLALAFYLIQIVTIVVVLSISAGEDCDTPLRMFLVMYGIRVLLTIPLTTYNRLHYNPDANQMNRPRGEVAAERVQNFLDFFGTVWFVIGNWWLFTSTTCSGTSSLVYYTSFTFVLLGYFIISIPLLMCLAMICCLPCVLYVLRNIKDEANNGASEQVIKALPLEKYKEDSMDKEDAVCVICLNEYQHDENIKRLPCNHHFHPACIDEWLHINKHCPLCMGNIDPNGEEKSNE